MQQTFGTGVSHVGLGYDANTDTVWVYGSFGADLRRFSSAGNAVGAVPRPGAAANDADIEVTNSPLTLGSTALPTGTLLYIDGESGVAEIYAVNPATGALITSLATQFGVSHVVGGAHHPARGTIFLVQDKIPGGAAANRVAEIDPSTGAVLGTFQITSVLPTFTVNFGDIAVAANGNLLVVSSDEATIAEFTPGGTFVREHALPAGVTPDLCGIGVDREGCGVWVADTSNDVYRMSGVGAVFCAGCDSIDFNNDGLFPDNQDLEDFLGVFGGGPCSTGDCADIDFNNDGLFPDNADLEAFFSVFGGGPC